MDNIRLALLEFHWSYIRDAKKLALDLREPSLPHPRPLLLTITKTGKPLRNVFLLRLHK